MRYILAIVVAVLALLCGVAVISAQDLNASELNRLYERLNVPRSIVITSPKSPMLPDVTPLKIFLGRVEDPKVRNKYQQVINEWNQKDGQKYGLIEVTEDITRANLILVRFVYRFSEAEWSRNSVAMGYMSSYAPLYSYIINRKPDSLEVVVRRVNRDNGMPLSTSDAPDYLLREKLFQLMRKKAKARKL